MRRLAAACAALLLAAGCATDADEPDEAGAEPSPEAAPSSTGKSGPQYVAMGDSYTSAPGIGEALDAGCFRSVGNYPSLVAEELGLRLTDVSCGGATTTSLVGVQETSAGPVPAQFSALTPETDVVTLSIGGNDESLFSKLLTTCLSLSGQDPDGAPCRDALNAGGTDEALATIELVQERVTSALVGIKDRAPDAEVLLVGYPQIVPAEGQCDELPLTPEDYEYARGLLEELGEATEAAAEEADVEYVDVLAASEGHDICAGPDAWVNGLANDDGRAAMGMHPFAEEQRAVADLIVEALAG